MLIRICSLPRLQVAWRAEEQARVRLPLRLRQSSQFPKLNEIYCLRQHLFQLC